MTNLLKSILLFFLFLMPMHNYAEQEKSQIGIGLASWAIFDDDDRKAVHLTYSLPAIRTLYDIKPVFLVAVAEQGQRYFAWGGNLDFYKVGIMSVGIGFHAGFIDRPKGLGHKVEYYTSFYTSYNITNNSSLKAEVGHISNGGFGDKNPGSESLVISFFHSF